jgi:RNA 3'-phosphate cyclase
MKHVFLPTLQRMGLKTDLTVHRYGYYPKGMGEVALTVEPCRPLQPIRLGDFGEIEAIKGVSVCTYLADRKVAERQAKAANKHLEMHGYTADIQVINDKSNPMQKGSSIVLWTETDTGAILGGDAIGELRKTSEAVGKEAAENLLAELSRKPTVDLHLADLLIPYMALAQGNSTYLAQTISDHLDTNIWLAEKLLDVKFKTEKIGRLYKVTKTG